MHSKFKDVYVTIVP